MQPLVSLRPVTADDLPILFAHQIDPEATRLAAFPARERDAFFMHWHAKVLGNPNAVNRAILCDGTVVGHIGAWLDAATGERFFGYWLGREFWGRGLASAAATQFLQSELRRPLVARVAKHNPASIRVLEKSGFVRSSEDEFSLPDGTRVGEFIYVLTTP